MDLGKQTQKERIRRALTKLPMGELTPGGAAPLWGGQVEGGLGKVSQKK